jgi:hypothetical protein
VIEDGIDTRPAQKLDSLKPTIWSIVQGNLSDSKLSRELKKVLKKFAINES